MKAVLISIRLLWCGKIARGYKTVELRKSRPKIETPFKCYIYCTRSRAIQFWTGPRYSYVDDHSHNQFDRCGNGMVIGEFVCDSILRSDYEYNDDDPHYNPGPRALYWPYIDLDAACLSHAAVQDYGGKKPLYSWHISDLKIYAEPKPLHDFTGLCKTKFGYAPYALTRPPQSWCYVEALT